MPGVVARMAPLSRPVCRGELSVFELSDQGIQRPFEDAGQVSGRNLMPQQLLRISKLVVSSFPERELNSEALRCERRNPGGRHWDRRQYWSFGRGNRGVYELLNYPCG